ncbi:unnamed protein product [Calicophoron daubneyi]|uniref:Uncharacterized protein n=1 Tax=Calicophoron daubneyi TaxID=300641 RepID=A0AAV2TYA3_CALDB
MTTFLLFFLCFFSSAQSFVVPHRVWLANTSQSDEFSHFVLHWIEKTDLAPVASAPLVIDADLDGSLDLFFATADGSLHGILQFMKCSVYDKRCNEIQHNWPVVLHGESFVSSPVPVRVDYAPVIIMFTSHRGGLWGFDCWGNIKVRFQLPDMWLDEEVTKRGLPVTDRRTLTEHLRWASTDRTADMDVKGIYRLQPTIYATPLAPVGTAHRRNLNTKESDVLILAVNFISSPDIRSLEGGIVVSGLVGISRRMLTADGISSTESLRRERAIHWVPLELDRVNISVSLAWF